VHGVMQRDQVHSGAWRNYYVMLLAWCGLCTALWRGQFTAVHGATSAWRYLLDTVCARRSVHSDKSVHGDIYYL
jgi:hypothetical protein